MSQIERHEPQQFGITTLDEAMRYAQAIAGAGLVPDAFRRKPADILVAQEIAKTMAESTWTVMSEMSIISGKPSFSAKFMRSRIRQAGHKLRESFDHDSGTARAVIIRADDPDFEHVAQWDEAKARQHNLWDKGHWKKNPELMLKNRAISEVMREACYEVMGGVAYTPDEVQDFAPVRQQATRQDVGQSDGGPDDRQDASQGEGGQQPQQAAPTPPPSLEEWGNSLLKLEEAQDLDKIDAGVKWAARRGLPEHLKMAQSTHARLQQLMQEQAVNNAQTVLDAEVVPA